MKTSMMETITMLVISLIPTLSHSQINASIKDLTLGCITDLKEIPQPDTRLVKIIDACRNAQITHANDLITPQPCNNHYVLQRTYLIVDECKNRLSLTQEIDFILEKEKPEDIHIIVSLGCNPDLSSAIPDPQDFDPPGCHEKFEWLGDERHKDGCNFSMIRKYQVFTECGSVYIYTIHYSWKEDHTPPVISCPPDIDLGCNPAAIPAPDPTAVKAKDECCDPQVSWLTDVIVSNPGDCHQLRIRKYIAEDCCGNQAICEQKITWTSDITPPMIISCPDGKDLGCNPTYTDLNDFLPKPAPGKVVAEDACSTIKVETTLSDITVFGCQYAISRIYTVSDECGNSAICLQTFTWTVDDTPPTIIHCPNDIDLGCNPSHTDLGLQSPDFGIIAEDNCGIEKIKKSHVSETLISGCQRYYTIEYSVYDYCGNVSTCEQNVWWTVDLEPPVIHCPANEIYCTTNEPPAIDINDVIALDNCGSVEVNLAASSINITNGVTTITRTFTAKDQCQNQSSCDQTIILYQAFFPSEDKQAVYDTFPTPNPFDYGNLCPDPVNFGCVSKYPEIPEPDNKFVTSPECEDFQVNYLGDDLLLVSSCEYVLTRSYQMIDCCGNEGICFQQFKWRIVEDTTTVIPFPEDQQAFCQIPPLPDFANQCGKYIPIYLGQTIEGDCDDGSCTIIRHWKQAVCGGVQLLHDQTIEVKCDITIDNKPGFNSTQLQPIAINIYPNPAREKIYLELDASEKISSVHILDVNGHPIQSIHKEFTSGEPIEIGINELPPGIYLVEIAGETVQTKRFIKTD
ncbi:MAG: T9SS type A sorting domain-containing protein [Saprospiraceae bacterium]|nr:T9SS type A sorting domain-containing protein [Saprospiraceae bacterium]